MPKSKGSWVEVPQYQRTGKARVPAVKNGSRGAGNNHPTSQGRHSSAQEALYRDWVAGQVPLELTFADGQTLCGTLTDYDTYALVIATEGRPQLVFKSAVQWMRELSPNARD
ncbi:MAG: RNA chaperone Hfq [Firmicutes bacterium]|jgi:sRNA-binding regulator protein Hfq|nr:RNA chaperone Hfq [Bacillota bacterium]